MLNQVILVGKVQGILRKKNKVILSIITSQKVYSLNEIEDNIFDLEMSKEMWEKMNGQIVSGVTIGIKGRLRVESKLLVIMEKVGIITITSY